MKYLLYLLLIFGSNYSFGQVSASQKKRIQKFIGEGFIEHSAISSYPLSQITELSSADTSIFVLGDTTGVHVNNEYFLFRDSIHFRKDSEYFSFVKSQPTSISEYSEFKNYVRDSIARMKIFYGEAMDSEAAQFVRAPRERRGNLFGRYSVYNNDRVITFEKYGLNWNRKFDYGDREFQCLLVDMYVPWFERFRKKREFDERKLVYGEAKKLTCVWNDYHLWARDASHDDDKFGVLSQIYPQINLNNPAVGLLGTQAQAFCHWKQKNLQKEFDRSELPFKVVVTLPIEEQLKDVESTKRFKIESRDYTDQWKITKEEYAEFVDYVEDSTLRTFLYYEVSLDELAIKFLQSGQYYLDEGALEFVDLDPSDRQINLELFPLDFKRKIKKNHWDIEDALKKYEEKKSTLTYRYSTVRTRAKARPPAMKFLKETGMFYSVKPGESKDLYNDSILNRRRVYAPLREWSSNAGVARIWRLDKYIDHHEVPVVLRKPEHSYYDKSLIPALTYEQAMAFYNWKYPIDKFNPEEDNWQEYVYPSEEEFRKIQNGESIVIPEHEVEFPTPLFRYVVHIYPKN